MTLAGTATVSHSWNKSIKLSGLISDAPPVDETDGTTTTHAGKLVLEGKDSGIFILSGNNNTFSGGVELKNGTLHVEGNESLGTGTTIIASLSPPTNGSLPTQPNLKFTREGGNTSSATIQVNNADGTAVATLSAKAPDASRAAATPAYTNMKVDGSGITRIDADKKASIANAALDIKSSYSVQDVTLSDTLVSLQENASLAMSNVVIGAGTAFSKLGSTGTLTIANSSLVLSSSNTTIGSPVAPASEGSNTP